MNQINKPRNFFQHKRVRIVVFATLIIAACVSYKIIITDDLEFTRDFGAINAQFFLDSFKLPISIVAAGLSILLLLATQHRSEQTAEQIKLANEANENSLAQNTLRNYYDSIADFEKYIKESYHSDIIEIKNTRQLYKIFFPENSHSFVCPYTTVDVYSNTVKRFLDSVKENIKTNKKNHNNSREIFEAIINYFISMLKTSYGISTKSMAFDTFAGSPVNDFLNITNEIRDLLTFCMNYTPSNGLVIIADSRVSDLKDWIDFVKENEDVNTMKYNLSKGGKINLNYK